MWTLLFGLALADPSSNPVLDALQSAAKDAGVSWPLSSVHLVVDKSDRQLQLFSGDKLVKSYRVGLGGAPVGDKVRQGDQRTPTGTFTVVTRNPKSNFTLFLGLSYPMAEDAKRGLASGLISPAQHDAIVEAERTGRLPLWNTTLGGAIGIHGMGGSADWTLGCVAVEDAEIRALWEVVPLGTRVVLRE